MDPNRAAIQAAAITITVIGVGCGMIWLIYHVHEALETRSRQRVRRADTAIQDLLEATQKNQTADGFGSQLRAIMRPLRPQENVQVFDQWVGAVLAVTTEVTLAPHIATLRMALAEVDRGPTWSSVEALLRLAVAVTPSTRTSEILSLRSPGTTGASLVTPAKTNLLTLQQQAVGAVQCYIVSAGVGSLAAYRLYELVLKHRARLMALRPGIELPLPNHDEWMTAWTAEPHLPHYLVREPLDLNAARRAIVDCYRDNSGSSPSRLLDDWQFEQYFKWLYAQYLESPELWSMLAGEIATWLHLVALTAFTVTKKRIELAERQLAELAEAAEQEAAARAAEAADGANDAASRATDGTSAPA